MLRNVAILMAMMDSSSPHGFLHQDAVDEFVEPVFMVVEPDDVIDGPAARGRVLADAFEGDRAEPTVKVGDGPDLARAAS